MLSSISVMRTVASGQKTKEVTMKIEQSLKLVSVTKPNQQNPVVDRRQRLITSINRQLDLIDRYRCGEKVRGCGGGLMNQEPSFFLLSTGRLFSS